MIVNGKSLLNKSPIEGMFHRKIRSDPTSFGLTEAGYDIRIKQDVSFDKPGFILASSVERFTMPINLVGILHDKSTWARLGLSVFNTVIEPGWEGYLTLELVYHGSGDLYIPGGSGIGQVIFHEVVETSSYKGKYQNQENSPVKAKFGV